MSANEGTGSLDRAGNEEGGVYAGGEVSGDLAVAGALSPTLA
jgi:hypothetical protein